jgi:hypothetical protein
MSMTACIDRFSFFNREIQFAGWAFVPDKTIVSIDLFIDDAVVEGTASINCASPDVEAHFGTVAANARFHGNARLPEGTDTPLNAALRFRFSDGTEEIKSEIGQAEIGLEPGHALFGRFLKNLKERRPGRFLEIGSRARSGISRRHLIPETWDYRGRTSSRGPTWIS